MGFTAHIDKNGDKQTVKEHCINTSDMCFAFSKRIDSPNIGKLQGLLHDVGKLTRIFDEYINGNPKYKHGDIDHSFAGAKFISETGRKIHCEQAADFIARTIISHHGLHDWVKDDGKNYFLERTATEGTKENNKGKNYEEVKKNIYELFDQKTAEDMLRAADEEFKMLSGKIKEIAADKTEEAFYFGLLERYFQSVLVDADRTDTANFVDKTEYGIDADTTELWKAIQRKMDEKLQSFANKTDDISLRRRSISDRCADFAKNDVKICRMVVPTGGGKTLSSLRFADEYCLLHDMDRIIYIAPFMSILEQNSDEWRKIVGDENFIEHHSNALAEISDNEYKCAEYELHTEKWDKPVIATTMVQFLNSLFSAKMSSVRRMHRLAKAVIIIDEVQSIPLRCVNLFNLAMNFLAYICNSVVVLCSATQPSNDKTAYPLKLDENCSMTGDYTQDFEVFKRNEIIPQIDPYGKTYEETADFCVDKFEESGNLLMIVNTKSSALKMYSLLQERLKDTKIIHLSTNMCPQHRKDKIALLRKMLAENKPVICVTTNLIEAGVDISFRCVIRSLTGLDSVVQAAGRCNRNGENNQICKVYIVKIKDEQLGSLRSIKKAQDISLRMVTKENIADYQQPEVLTEYFSELFRLEKKELSYPANDGDFPTTLLELLSLDKERAEISEFPPERNCAQAFRTAGSIFEVIDSNTENVIVPYNAEAEEIISKLEKAEDISLLLRKAQKYTVSVYNGMKNKLKEHSSLVTLDCGAQILDKEFYDDVKGIDIEGAEREVLIF